MTSQSNRSPVTIIGAGMSGAACAVALRAGGVPVKILDRGRAPGGRMASPLLHERRTDIGAGYFTVRDEGFKTVVDGWAADGLAHTWTDTFTVLAPGKAPELKPGPDRWGTPDGLRSLVRAMLDGFDVETTSMEELPDGDVVLAMPDPQAGRLTDVPDAVEYDPVIAVVCGFETKSWPFDTAAFVQGRHDIDFIADDGSRRGDGAAVLVAHTTSALAAQHLELPSDVIPPVVAALMELLGTGQPEWTHAHRWTFAKPAAQHDSTFALTEDGGRLIGFAGDQWCREGSPRIESAWRSGTELAQAIIARRS